jgi:multisubunit Na+/H+ antiporter MnhF subunit
MTLLVLFVILLAIAAIAGCYRLLTGPTAAHRMIALDLLFAIAVVLCIVPQSPVAAPLFWM